MLELASAPFVMVGHLYLIVNYLVDLSGRNLVMHSYTLE